MRQCEIIQYLIRGGMGSLGWSRVQQRVWLILTVSFPFVSKRPVYCESGRLVLKQIFCVSSLGRLAWSEDLCLRPLDDANQGYPWTSEMAWGVRALYLCFFACSLSWRTQVITRVLEEEGRPRHCNFPQETASNFIVHDYAVRLLGDYFPKKMWDMN